jgi:hypothetical protein
MYSNGIYGSILALSNKFPRGSSMQKDVRDLYWKFKQYHARFNFGYAITCHKSQGSTYSVTAVDQRDIRSFYNRSNKFNNIDYNRMMYTAITRSSNVTVLLTNVNAKTEVEDL